MDGCGWKVAVTFFRNAFRPITRTFCGLLAAGRPHRQKPDSRISNAGSLVATGRGLVLTLATLQKPEPELGETQFSPAGQHWLSHSVSTYGASAVTGGKDYFICSLHIKVKFYFPDAKEKIKMHHASQWNPFSASPSHHTYLSGPSPCHHKGQTLPPE